MRLSPPEFLRFSQANSFEVIYGGSESNVAVSLANYGIPVDFVTRLPKNDIGSCALMELRRRGVGIDQIIYGGDRLGLYYLEAGAVSRSSNVVYDRAHSAMTEITPGMIDWEMVFKDAQWFHWSGITPAISQSAADVCLEAIRIASKKGLTISTDLNHRTKLWNYGKKPVEIMPELVSYSNIILANKEDSREHLDIYVEATDKDDIEGKRDFFSSLSNQIMEKYPKICKVATTWRHSISASHHKWAGALYDGNKIYQSKEYEITHIVDRVGGGDSFIGGLIYGLLNYPKDNQQALDFATAAACLKHTIKGDANLATTDEVNKLIDGDTSGRISR